MMMHALNMVGTYLVFPFYIKIPHECQASSFSSDEFEPQEAEEISQIYRMNLSKFGQEENCFNKFLSGQY